MTVAELHLTETIASELEAEVLVLGVLSTDDGPQLLTDDPAFDNLRGSLAAIAVTGARDTVRRVPSPVAAASLALVGLGSEVSPESLRYAAGSAARQLVGIETLAIALPVETEADALAVLEGAAIGAYAYTEYRDASLASTKLPASDITVLAPGAEPALVDRATAVATAMHTVRDLVNAPPSDLYPATLADAAVALAEGLPVEVTVLDEAALAEGGFGGILGMGQGSTRGPRLVKVAYTPAGSAYHLALVGKGITFDTGGISLKPPASMVGMKYDMTGAATVLAVVLAAARLDLPIRLTAWLCIAENMPSGSATRPNDVLRIRGGRTVEVLNTDAEGRVVMADGLVAASEEHPDAIIDVATLTGAQRVALGDRFSGLMGDDDLVGEIAAAAKETGEQVWPMPLPGELRALLNSDVADIANAKIGSTAAGMLLAGVFLQEFVGNTPDGARIPWAHLDIAGPSNNTGGPFGFTGKGPTGVTVRALLSLAEGISLR